jgi:hypothetical protein
MFSQQIHVIKQVALYFDQTIFFASTKWSLGAKVEEISCNFM